MFHIENTNLITLELVLIKGTVLHFILKILLNWKSDHLKSIEKLYLHFIAFGVVHQYPRYFSLEGDYKIGIVISCIHFDLFAIARLSCYFLIL